MTMFETSTNNWVNLDSVTNAIYTVQTPSAFQNIPQLELLSSGASLDKITDPVIMNEVATILGITIPPPPTP